LVSAGEPQRSPLVLMWRQMVVIAPPVRVVSG
jgi:hypothetical protein